MHPSAAHAAAQAEELQGKVDTDSMQGASGLEFSKCWLCALHNLQLHIHAAVQAERLESKVDTDSM